MKKISVAIFIFLSVVFVSSVTRSHTGVPLNNLEGVGGIAFNPLAYTAGQPFESGVAEKSPSKKENDKEGPFSLKNIFSKPQAGAWYVRLNNWAPQSDIDWGNIGVAETLFKRVEISYGYQFISAGGVANFHKNNIGTKVLILEENFKGLNFIPAVSTGAIWKNSSYADLDPSVDSSGWDFYLVATKLITQLPRPILLSGGALSTQGRVTGALGFDHRRDYALFFGNVDILPFDIIAVGFEFREGARFKDFKDKNYWDAHVAWFANKNLTLIAAYTYTGHEQSKYNGNKFGLGGGLVLSAQYAF